MRTKSVFSAARAAALGAGLLLTLSLSGCALLGGPEQGAKLVDKGGFEEVKRLAPGLFHAQGLDLQELPVLDDGRERGSYGELVFKRLSPEFLYGEKAHDVYLGKSFRETLTPSSRVYHDRDGGGFRIVHPTQSLSMRLLAVVDWNVDGRPDWLLRCVIESFRGGKVRTYYLLAPDPGKAPKVQGSVLAVVDGMGAARPVVSIRDVSSYGREAELPPTEVSDSRPGERTVTEPPKASRGPDPLRERDL